MDRIFTDIYENSVWGSNNNREYKGSSGGGSDVDYNKDTYVPLLRKFIIDNDIKKVVDLGCGDFKCGPLIYNDLDISYTGYDAYKKVVEYNSKIHPSSKYRFFHLDFCNNKEDIVNGDICILKDVIQHWSLDKIYVFLDYLVDCKKFRYIWLTNCCNQTQDNTDINDGGGRPLSCDFYPLKKYKPVRVYNYNTKEVSIITIS